MAPKASSSLKKMKDIQIRQEGNNASSDWSMNKWLESHDLGLTLLPRQPCEDDGNYEADAGHANLHHVLKGKAEDHLGGGEECSSAGADLLELPGSPQRCPERTRSSEQRSKKPTQAASDTSKILKNHIKADSRTLRSVCRHPSNATSHSRFLPRSEASAEASVESLHDTSSANSIGKPCICCNQKRTRELAAPTLCNAISLPKERFNTRKPSPPCFASDYTTLQAATSSKVNLGNSKTYKQAPDSRGLSPMLIKSSIQKEGRTSRSWTKHFPCAVAKTPSSKITNLLFFPTSLAQSSAEYNKSNILTHTHPPSPLHSQPAHQSYSSNLKGSNFVLQRASSRLRDGEHHSTGKLLRSDYPDYQSAYCRRRSSSVPDLRRVSEVGKMSTSPTKYQIATPPNEAALLPISEEIDNPPSRIVHTEVETSLEDPQFHIVSPASPTSPFDPKKFFSLSTYPRDDQRLSLSASSSVNVPAATFPKQTYTASEVNAMMRHFYYTAESRVQDTHEKYDEVNRKLNALTHSHDRLQAAFETLQSTANGSNARFSILRSENNQLKKQLSKASKANDLVPAHNNFFAAPLNEFVPPTSWLGQRDFSKDIAYLDSIFPDDPPTAAASASAEQLFNFTFSNDGNAANAIDLTNSPPASRRSTSISSGRSRFSEEEKRQRKRLSNQISRQNAAKKRKLSDRYGAENPFLRQELAKLTTRTGRISKAGGNHGSC